MWRAGRASILLRRGSAACGTAALLLLLLAAARAPAASVGQIVWSAGNAIWVANADGTGARRLISGNAPQLAGALPRGVVSSPDVFAAGGTTVLFLGATDAFAPVGQSAACGQGCTDTFELRNGTLRDLGPPAGPLAQSAYHEAQPRLTADGEELFSWSLRQGIAAGATATVAGELAERPIPDPQDLGVPWSDTASVEVPGSGFDGAPDPAEARLAAWVQAQGCGTYTLDGTPACQYEVRVGTRSQQDPATSIYDDEYAEAAAGPTSLDWSPDGSTLLMVDPYAPNDGIFEFAATTPATPGKQATEILAQPAGWSFHQARFAGASIVFDAHQGTGSRQTGDIYTIPATCTAATCSFPASATNVSNDPGSDPSDPAWTSATTPLVRFDGVVVAAAGTARVTGVRLAAAPVVAARPFALLVTLSARAKILVTIARRRTGAAALRIGSVSFRGEAGANRVTIRTVAGRHLGVGSYEATVRAQGSSARPASIRFSVQG